MTWFSSQATSSKETASKPAVSLEFATTVSSRGIAPANAIIERLSASECRLRTVVFFETSDVVEFRFGLPPAEKVYVRGTVVARTSKGPRFVYDLRLDRMSAKEIDELARRVAECQRRMAAARSHEETINKLPTTEQLIRSSVRVMATFPLQYRTPKAPAKQAKAGDVSMGGLLMTCSEILVPGTPVELRFTLPCDALAAYPEETAVIDLKKGTVAPLRGGDQRRPFEEMVLGARVVAHRPLGNGMHAFGLAFTSINGYQREELARYTNAVQRARNRH